MFDMPIAFAQARRWLSLKSLACIVAAVVAVYTLAIVLLLVFEDRILYDPTPEVRSMTGCTVKNIELRATDGTAIHGLWFPREQAQGAVLIFHGRQGNLGDDFGPDDLAGWHNEVGVSAFIFSYPGYGKSGGAPSEAGCYAAAEAAYAWLTETQNVPPGQVLLYGRSLGSAVAIDVASRHSHRALLLVTPFTSLPDVADSRFPLLPAQLLMRNRFPSRSKIDRCTQPLLIVHGTEDRLVPFAMGKELFEAANEPKRFVPVAGAHHENCITPEFYGTIRSFLDDVEMRAPTFP
jgi:fermentation-respiration switch protein FrsA (DUF1100 family)